MNMDGKVFIITGGASGIGRAIADHLLAQGASISFADIQGGALNAPDVTKRDQFKAFLSLTRQKFGRLDGYANVAGTGHRLGHDLIFDLPDEEYDFIMYLNVRSTFIALGEALRPGALADNGSIVCVCSIFGQCGFNKGAVFAASKRAMVGMIKSAALDAGERGIRINIGEPGAIDTPMHRRNMEGNVADPSPRNSIPRLGTPDKVLIAGVISLF